MSQEKLQTMVMQTFWGKEEGGGGGGKEVHYGIVQVGNRPFYNCFAQRPSL